MVTTIGGILRQKYLHSQGHLKTWVEIFTFYFLLNYYDCLSKQQQLCHLSSCSQPPLSGVAAQPLSRIVPDNTGLFSDYVQHRGEIEPNKIQTPVAGQWRQQWMKSGANIHILRCFRTISCSCSLSWSFLIFWSRYKDKCSLYSCSLLSWSPTTGHLILIIID